MKINTLQIIRAIAALAVVITHVFQKLDFKPFGDYILSGQYGVDIFFILSGFLIYTTTKKSTSVKDYTKKRLFRIYPLYLFALFFYIIILSNIDHLKLNFNVLIQNILMIPWESRWSYNSLIIGVAWSTLFELFFYTIFFFIILFRFDRRAIFFIIPVIYIICLSLAKFGVVKDNVPFIALLVSLGGSVHIFKFFIGCVIAELYVLNKIPKTTRNNYKFILITSVIIMFVALLTKYNLLLSIISCTFLFVCVSQYESYFSLDLKSPIINSLIYLGDISYSIYIVHILIIKILMSYFGINMLLLLLPLTIIVTIVVSIVTYKVVELRFINLAKRNSATKLI